MDVDGEPWRTLPDGVVLVCGLAVGIELERPLLRRLRQELRRAEALARAGRALSQRPLSERRLNDRLAAARVPVGIREDTVASLRGIGVVDDRAFAARRADELAHRGWGDAAIAARLTAAGVAGDVAREAVDGLAPEVERARELVSRSGDRRRSLQLLVRRGFGVETAETLLGALDDGP